MRIALDATYSIGDNLSGVGVYSREILHGVAGSHPEAEFLFTYRPHRFLRSFKETLPANAHRRLLHDIWPPRAGLFHGLNQRLPRTRLRRAVTTFHDLFVITGEYSTPEFRHRFEALARDAAQRSDLIITVSEFTACQVEALLGVERSRLRPIPHGVRQPPLQDDDEPRENIVLHVGAVQKRKNLVRLVAAFERMPPGWRLVLAGSFGYGADEVLGRIEASARKRDIQVLGYVPAEVLSKLYRRAAIFAFPSLDEGFGIPVLEAMANGVPVLASNCSALPEAGGDAVVLADPADSDSLAAGLLELAGNSSLREELVRRGKVRIRGFTWDAAVDRTWAVYRELV